MGICVQPLVLCARLRVGVDGPSLLPPCVSPASPAPLCQLRGEGKRRASFSAEASRQHEHKTVGAFSTPAQRGTVMRTTAIAYDLFESIWVCVCVCIDSCEGIILEAMGQRTVRGEKMHGIQVFTNSKAGEREV